MSIEFTKLNHDGLSNKPHASSCSRVEVVVRSTWSHHCLIESQGVTPETIVRIPEMKYIIYLNFIHLFT